MPHKQSHSSGRNYSWVHGDHSHVKTTLSIYQEAESNSKPKVSTSVNIQGVCEGSGFYFDFGCRYGLSAVYPSV